MNAAGLPLVSIVTRSMGRASLADALASIGVQLYSNIEAIVVDAKGSDHPPVPDKAGPFPLRLATTGQALLRAQAANVGLDHARGRYVGFLDDDDLLEPVHVAALVQALATAPTFRIAYSGTRLVDRGGLTLEHYSEPFNRVKLMRYNYINVHAVLFERALLTSGCRFDSQFEILEDWDFWLQLAQTGDFLWVPQITATWRADHGASGTGRGVNFTQGENDRYRALLFDKWRTAREALFQDLDQRLNSGLAAFREGRLSAAAKAMGGVLAADPANAVAANVLGRLAFDAHRFDDARQILTAVLQAAGDSAEVADVHFNLGLALQALGDADTAALEYHRALELDPQFAPARVKLQTLSSPSP